MAIKTTPKSIESEQALLGTILLDPSVLDRVNVSTAMFFSDDHQVIYSAMRSLGSKQLDVITLTEILERKGQLKDVGGELYLAKLAMDCPPSHNWEAYQRIIHDTHKRRQIITQAEKLAGAAMDESQDINQAVAEVTTNIVKSAEPLNGTVHISDYLKRVCDRVEKRAADPKHIYGLETGITDFDKITHGLQKRETVVLAGAPGTGKSILGFQIITGIAERGHPGCVYELEMSGEAVTMRKASAMSRIPTEAMKSGVGMNDKWEAFVRAIDKMSALPIYMSDFSNFDPIAIRADLARRKLKNDIEWFLVDYMDLINADGYDSYERSAYISQQLHGIAKDLDLAGLIIHSLNKAGYSNTSMQNLSGSAKVSYDADQVIFLEDDPDEKGLNKIITLTWAKMREGVNNRKIKMIMTGGIPEFKQIARDEPAIAEWTNK